MSTKNTSSIEAEGYRKILVAAHRIVIKVGSRLLARESGKSESPNINALVQQIAAIHNSGKETVFVTSGAIGTGMQILGLKKKPSLLAKLQMAAAVGQSRLMAHYEMLFQQYGCMIGQILLTHDDLRDRLRHLNARRTFLTMLENKIIPIVNENDVVAVDEIKFGDNDLLAALVSQLIDAELLIMLTTSDGLKTSVRDGKEERVPFLSAITEDVFKLARGKGGDISTGGMASKLEWARVATRAGVNVVIADGRKENILYRIVNGEDTGTLIAAAIKDSTHIDSNKKRWIAFFHKVQGELFIDDGAKKAILEKGKSLLPIGVIKVQGIFPAGAAIEIRGLNGELLARGLSSYSSADLQKIIGKKSKEIKTVPGVEAAEEEVVHRDNMALLSAHQE
jgi:glutamate 5-kinase